jgi:signal transduction histidine kinase/ABC-type multidrug transport system ATPase subunit
VTWAPILPTVVSVGTQSGVGTDGAQFAGAAGGRVRAGNGHTGGSGRVDSVSSMGDGSARLEVRGLVKRFGRHVVLDGVDLTVRAGELVALVGENGAGKTTLVQCVAGTLGPDAGEIVLADDRPPAVVWQDLALCENLDVTANLFLGREPGRFWITDAGLDHKARRLLDELGIRIDDLRRPVSALSGGQRQQLAIARALADQPRLLVLDEPTASLGVLETRGVERLLRDLRASGCALLLISHRIEQLFGLADRIVVLRHGRVVADRPTVELHPDDVVSLMAGLDADTTARRQMERLRSLVDQLAEVEPSASIPLIVSALSTAVGAHQVCVHLTVPGPGEPRLRRRAAVGVRPPLLAANAELPIGAAGGLVGLAAERRRVIVTDDVRRHPAWDGFRDAGLAAGVLSAWAMPIESADGVLGVISVYADAVGRPQPAVLELAAMYTNLAVAAIEREWLLGEVMRRNQILESLRGMLDRLTGPEPDEGDLSPALAALCAGLGAGAVVVCVGTAEGLTGRTSTDAAGRRAPAAVEEACLAAIDGATADERVLAVPLAVPDRRVVLVAWWAEAAARGVDAADLLADAGRSLSLAIEREDVAAARLEAAALRRAQQAQREFLSRLSHELRTPLTAIHGYASTLRQPDVDWDDASESRFLDVIVGESARMGRLVADLLDTSTIEAGGLRLDRHWCDLHLAAESAVTCVPGAAGRVSIDVDQDVRRAWVDHDRIEQVLVNLLDNAVTHGPPGGPIEVFAVPGPRAGTVRITVRDAGAGFPPELGGRAFRPYVRGETDAPGAGLGLAVCRGIVEAHGGTIAVDAGDARSAVVVTIPLDPPPGVVEAADADDLEVDERAAL